MNIATVNELNEAQVDQIKALMKELNPTIRVTNEMIKSTIETVGSIMFVLEDEGVIIGCATLGVYNSPTGKKAHVEDVVVKSTYRGKHLGLKLMEYIISYVRNKLVNAEIYLTSHSSRIEANQLYKKLGFQQRETNVYKMVITASEE